MKVATQCALASGLLLAGLAHACATPVEVEGCQATAPGAQNCDVLLSPASDFGGPDASVPTGGSGNTGGGGAPPGNAGSGNLPSGGSAGSGNPPAGGSGGLSGTAGSGSGAGGAGGASNAGSGGAAGAGNAGAGNAGAGNAGAGNAGAGNAGSGAGGTGSQSSFNLASCDLQDQAGCEEFACATACPQNMGNYCLDNCNAILTCVAADDSCITEADPMCGTPSQNPFMNNQCTMQVNNSSNPNTVGTPANVALALIRCLCSDPRP